MLRLSSRCVVQRVGGILQSELHKPLREAQNIGFQRHTRNLQKVPGQIRDKSNDQPTSSLLESTEKDSPMESSSDPTSIDLPDELRAKLAEVNDMLGPSMADPDIDINRGVHIQAARLRMIAPSNARRRKINNNVARAALNRLLYQRHALKHGYPELRDMVRGNMLASSLIGEKSKVNITLVDAKKIIKERFRYRKSSLLADFLRKHEARKQRARKK